MFNLDQPQNTRQQIPQVLTCCIQWQHFYTSTTTRYAQHVSTLANKMHAMKLVVQPDHA
ncbi:MAG: hypothetical protein ACJAS0_001808 [Alcanivorax borkumensis]|jgi:hypothetical protein